MKVNANEMKDVSYISYCRVLHKLLNTITYKRGCISAPFSTLGVKKTVIRLIDKKTQDVMPSLI